MQSGAGKNGKRVWVEPKLKMVDVTRNTRGGFFTVPGKPESSFYTPS